MSSDAEATTRARTGTDRFEPEALHLFLLDQPQELPLRVERQLVDAIQVHDALAGQLESARPGHRGVGERATLVAEQLGFNQRRRQAGTIDDDKRMPLARGERVQGARHQVLADAGAAGDEDVGIGRGIAGQLGEHRAHRRAARHQRR